MSDNHPLVWVGAGIALLIIGGVSGWGIYEHNQKNKARKKGQDAEFNHQKDKKSWQQEKTEYARMIFEETQKRTDLKIRLNRLIGELEEAKKHHVFFTDDEIASLNIIVSDGADIFTKKNNVYLLSDHTIKKAMEMCSEIQKTLQQQKESQNSDLFSYLEDLNRRLSIRLYASKKQTKYAEEWQTIMESYKEETSIQVIPKFKTNGGFICSFGEYSSVFMPFSHSISACAIGQPVNVLILGIDYDRRHAVISAREFKKRTDFERFVKNNPPGTKVSGKIACVLGEERYAALLSFPGYSMCGYLPASNVFRHPAQLSKDYIPERPLDVYIKKIDPNKHSILLSMYAPQKKSFKR
jgi:hypothetical protein